MVKLQVTSNRTDILPIIQSAIAAKVKRTELGLRYTENELRKFEMKYQIPSDQFLQTYTAEDLDGRDDEYISWMGEIKLRQSLVEELQALYEIEYVPERLSC
jgi:hypothetical protein